MEEGLKVSFLGDLTPLKAAFVEAANGVQKTANTINKTIATIGQGVKVEPVRVKVDVDKIAPPQLPKVHEWKIPVSLIPPAQLPPLKTQKLQIESVVLPPKLPTLAPIDVPIHVDATSVVSQLDSIGAALQNQIPSWQQLNKLFHGIFHGKYGHEGMTMMSEWRKEVEAGKISFTDFIKRLNLTEAQADDVAKKMREMGFALADAPKRGIKSLQQLQAQLERFEAALRTATNPESMLRLQRAIDATKGKMQSLSAAPVTKAFDGMRKSSNTAGMAMMDFSRIIQDMPYGFMAISNNLNPMFESFSRLKVEAGGTKAAFSAMLGQLSGPMGIGLAIATVSSLLVKFGGDLFESGGKAKSFKGDLEAVNAELERSKDAFENVSNAIEYLNQLGSINIDISGLGKALDLEGQGILSDNLIYEAEQREKELQKIVDRAFTALNSNKIEKRNIWGELISTEEDPDLKAAYQKAEDDLKSHQYKLRELRQKDVVIGRQITKQKLDDQKEANEKEEAERKKSLEAWKKYLEGLKQVQEMLAAIYTKIHNGDVDMSMVPGPPNVTDWVDEYNKNLQQQGKKMDALNVPDPQFDSKLYDATKKDLLEQYQKMFKSLGRDLPKQIDMGSGFMMDLKVLNIDQIKEKLGALFTNIKEQVTQTAAAVSSILSPAFQNLFTAITAGEQPIKAFFESIKQSIVQLINQLIAAAVQALVLSALTGGGTSFASAFKGIMGVKKFEHGGIISGPTLGLMGEYAGARNNPEVVAPLNKLRGMIAGTGGGNVTVTGRLRGGDIYLSSQRTLKKQRGRR